MSDDKKVQKCNCPKECGKMKMIVKRTMSKPRRLALNDVKSNMVRSLLCAKKSICIIHDQTKKAMKEYASANFSSSGSSSSVSSRASSFSGHEIKSDAAIQSERNEPKRKQGSENVAEEGNKPKKKIELVLADGKRLFVNECCIKEKELADKQFPDTESDTSSADSRASKRSATKRNRKKNNKSNQYSEDSKPPIDTSTSNNSLQGRSSPKTDRNTSAHIVKPSSSKSTQNTKSAKRKKSKTGGDSSSDSKSTSTTSVKEDEGPRTRKSRSKEKLSLESKPRINMKENEPRRQEAKRKGSKETMSNSSSESRISNKRGRPKKNQQDVNSKPEVIENAAMNDPRSQEDFPKNNSKTEATQTDDLLKNSQSKQNINGNTSEPIELRKTEEVSVGPSYVLMANKSSQAPDDETAKPIEPTLPVSKGEDAPKTSSRTKLVIQTRKHLETKSEPTQTDDLNDSKPESRVNVKENQPPVAENSPSKQTTNAQISEPNLNVDKEEPTESKVTVVISTDPSVVLTVKQSSESPGDEIKPTNPPLTMAKGEDAPKIGSHVELVVCNRNGLKRNLLLNNPICSCYPDKPVVKHQVASGTSRIDKSRCCQCTDTKDLETKVLVPAPVSSIPCPMLANIKGGICNCCPGKELRRGDETKAQTSRTIIIHSTSKK